MAVTFFSKNLSITRKITTLQKHLVRKMHFNRLDLQQLTPEYVHRLSAEQKAVLCEQLRKDLIEAQDRLNRNPSNSSSPSSSRMPWDRSINDDEPETTQSDENLPSNEDHQNGNDEEKTTEPAAGSAAQSGDENTKKTGKKKPGKQRGAPGFGRTQKLIVTHEVIHRAGVCKGCGCQIESDCPFHATGGHYTIDLELLKPGTIGISGSNTKHIYGYVRCSCGFETNSSSHKAPHEPGWTVDMGEWKLIGPKLLAFLVFLKLRMHATLSKSSEILSVWLGIRLSDGCINQALREAGRAVSCFEPEILAALKASGLMHMDETTWKEHKVTRWFWAAVSERVVYYAIGARSLEVAQRILEGFKGILMTDGYTVYRHYENRIRCWPHLERKALALYESWDKETSSFGAYAVSTLKSLRQSVYKMREMEPSERSLEQQACQNTKVQFLYNCLEKNDSQHELLRAFTVEILNDSTAIFRVIKEPELPLSNNAAERTLRCWVILRNMCYGSKTEEGSKTIAALASVVDTLRLHKREVWSYLADVISLRRSGCSPLPLLTPA